MANETSNPLFASQWYLKNTGQRGPAGIDINISPVWLDYTGTGIIVAVNDDGMDLTHPDLVGNILTNKVFDSERQTTGQGFVTTANTTHEHGTVVGSIIGMANNGIGGVGVAYDAKLVPGTHSGGAASAFLANLASGASVSCNSWGSDPAFSDNPSAGGTADNQAVAAALLRCVTEARDGLGMVIEVSGGNERGNKADAAMVHFNSARYIISVGAVNDQGVVTDYSTPGASLLVTAPGGVGAPDQSVNSGYGIVSADIQSDKGYNKTAGVAGDYAYQNQGTSYSGPMVSGISALMLQANPRLGFRDVSDILAMTARKNDLASPSWVATKGGNWNMTDMHFSRDYGFGLVDAAAAVHLAESWTVAAGTVTNWVSKDAVSSAAPAAIPEGGSALTVTATMADNIRMDRVEVLLELDAVAPSQLMATLTSPNGTTVTLFDAPLTRPLKDGAPDMTVAETAWPGVFTIGATAFLGESSQGTWTIKLYDKVTSTTATYKSATVRAWGSNITTDDNLVFTNEFTGTKTLTDAAGTDTLNAAALSTAVTLDLRAGAKSTLTTGDVTLAEGTVIENAIGGDGADTLTGNDLNNTLRGNRGNDAIDGGSGSDTAVYRGLESDYTITVTATGYTISGGTEGTDTLTNVEFAKFANTTRALTPTKAITYSTTTFTEAVANDGSITATSTLTLAFDTFVGNVGAALGTVTNTPAGLTAVLVKASDTTATLSFTGSATAHANANDISNLTVTLGDAAFTGGNAAAVTGATKNNLVVDFADPANRAPTLTQPLTLSFASKVDYATG
ncbi:MAG: S8 family serine peptidase, partial [Rhodoferax sp.]|nr:S8 family serine peptidase [Rhodoferax sp.]